MNVMNIEWTIHNTDICSHQGRISEICNFVMKLDSGWFLKFHLIYKCFLFDISINWNHDLIKFYFHWSDVFPVVCFPIFLLYSILCRMIRLYGSHIAHGPDVVEWINHYYRQTARNGSFDQVAYSGLRQIVSVIKSILISLRSGIMSWVLVVWWGR